MRDKGLTRTTEEVMKDHLEKVFSDVANEISRQRQKWGIQDHHPQMWMNILMEEVGEASQAMMEAHFRGGNKGDYQKELVQVAAVAISAIENYWRGNKP